MKEVKRLRRIVAVRTTQLDISAMQLLAARLHTQRCEEALAEAQERLILTSQMARKGAELTQVDLERMGAARSAAWEEIAAWQKSKQSAEQAEESARSLVEAQHLRLRQSERLGEQAERDQNKRHTAAERQLLDEQASRGGRGIL